MKLPQLKASVGTGILIFAIVAFALVSSAIAFAYQETADNNVPIGTESVFRINEISVDKPKSAVIGTIQALAVQQKRNIYKMAPDPENVHNGRILFAFIGDQASFIGDPETWKYPSFSTSFETTLIPHTQITTQDMRGLYATNIDEASFAPLLGELKNSGVGASIEPVPTSMILGGVLFGETSAGPVLIVTFVGIFLAAAFYASRRFAVYSIRHVHGRSKLLALLDEYAVNGKLYCSVVLVCGAGVLASLSSYNRLVQGTAYLATVGLLILGGAAVVLLGQAAAFLIMSRWQTAEIIKGRRPLVFLTLASVAAQLITLAVCFPTISAGVQTIASIARDSRLDAKWLAAKSFVTVSFSGTNTPTDLDAITSRFGELAKKEEQSGRLIVSKPADGTAGYGPYTGNSLIVNNRYLSEQDILSSDNQRIAPLPEADGKLYLLIPESLRDRTAAIVAESTEWALFQQSLEPGAGANRSAPEVSVIETAPGQEVFTYGSNPSQTQVSQFDPVIAVVPASSGILSSGFYLSAASSGAVLFTDTSKLGGQLAAVGIAQNVSSMDSVSDRALAERNSRLVKARILAISLILFAVMLLVVGAVLTRVYCERSRQRLFVEAVHGKAFAAMHAEYFLLTAVLAAVVLVAEVLVGAVTSILSFYICLLAAVLFLLTTLLLTKRQQKSLFTRFAW